jgi:hypothetical protein
MPDFTAMPRANEAHRMRVEPDTRHSINTRFWESVQISGPTAVSAAMVAKHPTHAVSDQMPSQARTDHRQWVAGAAPPYYPDVTGPGQRPMLPPSSVWENPHFTGWDPEHRDTTRELRFAVKESMGYQQEDASLRSAQRQFAHPWLPATSVAQMAVAERMRPAQDDYRVSWMPQGPPTT